ncbi:MAG: hypothetical protein ABSG36_13755 [Acidimicrobiales bacterium]
MSRFRMLTGVVAGVLVGGLVISFAASGSPRAMPSRTWSASTPSVPGAPITSLVAVSCLTARNCWAVGDRFKSSSSNAGPALIEHFTANAWRPVTASAAQGGTLDELSGVSCLSATNCWAAGMRSGSHPGNLLEHYGAGRRWATVASPGPQGELSAISCDPSDDQCWAIGTSSDFKRPTSFHLVKGVWHFVPPVSIRAATFVQLNGVACVNHDDCLLVGFATPKAGTGLAVAERWDGHVWSRVTVAGVLAGGGSLSGVACLAKGTPACWAVGQTVAKGEGLVAIHPLLEGWNTRSLSLVQSPPGRAGDYPELSAIACAASTACQAVGSRGSGQDEASLLTEGWGGSRWSTEASPSPLYGFQALTGVACPSASDCWAVGAGLDRSSSGSRMIIEHFSASS